MPSLVRGQYFRGYLVHPAGDRQSNPCVKNVIQSINTLQNRGESLGFNWGDDYPEVEGSGTKSHWQGIQRLFLPEQEIPYLIVASSHRHFILQNGQLEQISAPAHFAVVAMGSRQNNGLRLRSNRLAPGKLTREVPPNPMDFIAKAQSITLEYDHPGGIQIIGKYLLVGSDGNIGHTRDTALFTLWDLEFPLAPRLVWQWELPGQNANSVGIVRLEDGRYLMLRALTDAKQLEFYLLSNDLEQDPNTYHDKRPWDRWDFSELQSELKNPDSSLDKTWADLGNILGEAGYQNTNLIKECESGQLYLVASHGRRPTLGGADFVDAYRLDVPLNRPDPDQPGQGVIITKVAKRQMFPEDNAGERGGDLQAAGGVYISPNNKLYFYATEHGVTGAGGFVKMIEFAPEIPLEQVENIDDAWVRLYAEKNFQGRYIALDYIDRHLLNYKDFSTIENFQNQASSIIYAIPPDFNLRLYAETDQQGGFFDLKGSGKVEKIPDLAPMKFSNGDSLNNHVNSAIWMISITQIARETGQFISPSFKLLQNFPNPFNSETLIEYELTKETHIRLEIITIEGRLIKTLVNEKQSPGVYTVRWDGTDYLGQQVASGIYFYQLSSDDSKIVRKLSLIR